MTCIYDDVNYIELINAMIPNEDNQFPNIIDAVCHCENSDEVGKIFEYMNQKKMFEKLLKETLNELNTTNPSLESYKYHTLCFQANRYNQFIRHIEHFIEFYEWKITRNKHKDYKKWAWEWSWKLMTFLKIYEEEPFINYKNDNDKKKD
jgi:hypothetical protein